MATVGDPLMDLGTSLAYWAEPGDPEILKLFNLSYLESNLTRKEVIGYYCQKSQLDLSNILFCIFGLFKVAVIAQQIYKRFTQGHANDPRFSALIQVVEAVGKRAHESILIEKKLTHEHSKYHHSRRRNSWFKNRTPVSNFRLSGHCL